MEGIKNKKIERQEAQKKQVTKLLNGRMKELTEINGKANKRTNKWNETDLEDKIDKMKTNQWMNKTLAERNNDRRTGS